MSATLSGIKSTKDPVFHLVRASFHCDICDVSFKRQAKLDTHFLSRKHLALKAEIDARDAPATPSPHPESSSIVATSPLPNVPSKPLDFGKCDNDALDELQKRSGQELMTLLSINPGGCGYTPCAKLFRLLFLDDKVPNNVNVLIEGQGLDSATYYFRQGHWRESDCPELTLEDCLNNSAV